MTSPFPLPDWLPWWVTIAVLVPALLYLLVFLLMPFSVFGLKGRLNSIEARLDELQGEIRTLVLRMPESRGRGMEWTDPPPPIAPAPCASRRTGRCARQFRRPPSRCRVARQWSLATGRRPTRRHRPRRLPPDPAEEPGEPRHRPVIRPARPQRSEPRLDWPR